jgi:SAM-dependent methyltransferase
MVGGSTAADHVAAQVLEAIAEYGPPRRVNWIQRVRYEQMPRYYSMAAASGGCLISTSIDESFGMTLAEAMACRCPVAAARVGALPELLVGQLAEGLFELGAVDEGAALVVRLACDAAWRRSLQDFGEEQMRIHHDIKKTALDYLAVIRRVMAERKGAKPALAMAPAAEDEAARAESFWAEYPLTEFYFTGKESVQRSRWLAGEVLSRYEFSSVLEPGCNCGRNLYYILDRYPNVEAHGFDVNEQAIAFAKEHVPGASFEIRSVHEMADIPDDRYDIIFTMSLLDHVPEVESVCREFLRIARKAVVLVEVDTGTEGKCIEHLKQQGVDNYCYSRNYARLFESLGAKVLRYQPVVEHFPETFMGPYYWLLEAAPPGSKGTW